MSRAPSANPPRSSVAAQEPYAKTIPSALPCTEIIDVKKLEMLSHLLYSGTVDPRELRKPSGDLLPQHER